jgi:hypothetical protein
MCAQTMEIGKPQPIKKFIPEWYKKAETHYVSDEDSISVEDGNQKKSPGLKTCVPFLDALTSGYALVTPFDIYVGRTEDGDLDLRWNAPQGWEDFVMERPKQSGATMPRPAGHAPNHLVWSGKWGIKVPRGYSVLVTHPLNRQDLPFTTSSAIMDSDKFYGNGNMPFFIKEDFVGVIEKNTPFAQIIPIKRDRWKMINNDSLKYNVTVQGHVVREKEGSYKRKFWTRKEYS